MARVKGKAWEQLGARASSDAHRPELFVEQHTAPLFFGRTCPTAGEHEQFDNEEAFWNRSASIPFASVCLNKFRLSDWFPRAPGVYWSRYGTQARQSAWEDDTTNDPQLGHIFNPESKRALIEEGGMGTIRLRPRRIDNTDCWLASAIKGPQCAGGIPLAIPNSFLREAKVTWGDTAILYGRVRFLQDVGLVDTAAHVHHASPLIIFVERINTLPIRKQLKSTIIITPVALFDRKFHDSQDRYRRSSRLGYTFVQSAAGSDAELNNAAEWIESYAEKHSGRVITNFDELSPILADAPLSYQRLVRKDYDRTIIEHLHFNGASLTERIDLVENITTEYNNYGQAGAFGENASVGLSRFTKSPRAQPAELPSIFASWLGQLFRRKS
jgi:hypothetical protein